MGESAYVNPESAAAVPVRRIPPEKSVGRSTIALRLPPAQSDRIGFRVFSELGILNDLLQFPLFHVLAADPVFRSRHSHRLVHFFDRLSQIPQIDRGWYLCSFNHACAGCSRHWRNSSWRKQDPFRRFSSTFRIRQTGNRLLSLPLALLQAG